MIKGMKSLLLAGFLLGRPCAMIAAAPEEKPPSVDHLKIAASMFGSAQRWTDRRIVGEYRLQNRNGSDAWRVLDAKGNFVTSGSREACETRLAKRLKIAPTPLRGEVIVLVHGLFQTRAKMESIENYLEREEARSVVNFGYASTKAEIEEHAAALREVLEVAGPEAKVSFVGHSMGCIVIRSLLADRAEAKWKLGRVVMLGPPNQGAEMARRFVGLKPVSKMLGPGFDQLADAKRDPLANWPAPPCEFAVIAGDCPTWMLNNPLIEGEDDWIVGVSETRLPGAKCEACVDSHHGDIVHDSRVLKMIDDFLTHGELTPTKAAPARKSK